MKNKIIFSIAVLTASLILVSCKKDKEEDNHQHNNTPALTATINIAEPVADATYEQGEVVEINATVTADFHMHGYEAYLINLTANDTVWSVDAHAHGESYTIQGSWTNNVTEHSEMKLKIIAALDHDGTTAVKEVAFHCNQ